VRRRFARNLVTFVWYCILRRGGSGAVSLDFEQQLDGVAELAMDARRLAVHGGDEAAFALDRLIGEGAANILGEHAIFKILLRAVFCELLVHHCGFDAASAAVPPLGNNDIDDELALDVVYWLEALEEDVQQTVELFGSFVGKDDAFSSEPVLDGVEGGARFAFRGFASLGFLAIEAAGCDSSCGLCVIFGHLCSPTLMVESGNKGTGLEDIDCALICAT
jgi:hypothetical protein